MKLVLFSKALKDKSVERLIELGRAWGIDGYDLCLRPGYPVNPDNVADALPAAVKRLRGGGLDVPMVTGDFDLLEPEHPTARPILAAMNAAGVRLLKLGYFRFDPAVRSYGQEVERIRRIFARWEPPAREHRVKICYHSHSNWNMGLNGAALYSLLAGFDPALLGAYLDPAHLVIEGENFATAVQMVREYLSIVSLKDVLLVREERNGHGSAVRRMVAAGEGMVDWTAVFEALREVGFDGPLSIHCEMPIPEGGLDAAVRREVNFFRRFVDA